MSIDVTIKASPFVSQIVSLMPESTQVSLWNHLQKIRSYARGHEGTPPGNSVVFTRSQIDINGVGRCQFTFKWRKDGSYALRAIATVQNQGKAVIEVGDDRAILMIPLMEQVLNIKKVMPLRTIIDYPLLAPLEIRRIDGEVIYLKSRGDEQDITPLLQSTLDAVERRIEEAPLTLQDFLKKVAATGRPLVDLVLMEFLRRMERDKKLGLLWDRLTTAGEIRPEDVDVTDLLRLERGARLIIRPYACRDDTKAFGPYRTLLGMKYTSDRVVYCDGRLRWMGSRRKNWGDCERSAFWRMNYSKNGQSGSFRKDYTRPIGNLLKRAEEGNSYWYSC